MDTGKVFAGAGLSKLDETPTSLPAGYTLGDIRIQDDNHYRLCYNAGNSAIATGFFASPVSLGSCGPNSVTVSTASKTFAHLGAVLAEQTTVPTGAYFWGLYKGVPANGVAADTSSIVTGSPFHIAANGQVFLHPQSVVTGNKAVGYVLGGTSAGTVTTAAASGDVIIDV